MHMTAVRFGLGFMGLMAITSAFAAPQSPAFNYQGRLEQNGAPIQGSHNLIFKLFDAPSGGSQVGSTVTSNGYVFTDGLVSLGLNFGNVFSGEQRYLEVTVDGVTLSPRTAVYSSPVATFSQSVADGSVSRTSLSGAVANGSISLNIAANACVDVTLSIPDTQPNDVAMFTYGATAVVPAGVLTMPLQVKSADQMSVRFCNLSSSPALLNNVPVRVQTIR